jgi:Lon protease-like protein
MAPVDDLLPIFPLSNVVLFPKVKTPLHLFEPRYRQLAREVLDGDRRIGMTVVRPEHADEMGGNPPLFPIGCCGVVTESQRLPDGRYNIVLLGRERFRIVGEEKPEGDRLYRVARVQTLEDPYGEGDRTRVASLRTSIVENVGVLVRHTKSDRANQLDPDLFAGIDDETFVNTLCNGLAFPVEEKQVLLEANSIAERFARLAAYLSFRRAEIEGRGGSGSRTLH